MNKRLKELAADAGYPDYMTYGQDKVLERFAELIVKECAVIANKAENNDTEIRCMYDVITEHFGVE